MRTHLAEALRLLRVARSNLNRAVSEASSGGADPRGFFDAQQGLTRAETAIYNRHGELARRRGGV